MNGSLGVPAGGFTEPLRSRILKGKPPTTPDGQRTGQSLPEPNFELQKEEMSERTGKPFMTHEEVALAGTEVSDYLHYNDILSH